MNYQVMWAASIEAPNPLQAAREAFSMIAKGAHIFTVIDMEGGKDGEPEGYAVDLRVGTVDPLNAPMAPEVAVTPLPRDEGDA